MRKEVLFAVILGLILGGVIIYGVLLANRSTQELVRTEATPTLPNTNSLTPTPQPGLSITSPADHSVSFTDSVIITGTAQPSSQILIAGPDDQVLVPADQAGKFSATITLTGGENKIEITSLATDQTTQTTQISIIYTTAKIN